jgi:Ca2+:H+ antiporter
MFARHSWPSPAGNLIESDVERPAAGMPFAVLDAAGSLVTEAFNSRQAAMLFYVLLLLIPLSWGVAYWFPDQSTWIFLLGALAIVPLAEWIRRSTEQMAHLAGPAIGGLLNVSFGNLAELILAAFVLLEGKSEVVKAQITGAIIGNSLLGLGLAVVAGTWGREKQTFNRERAGLLSSLLMLVVIALLVPALFDYTERQGRSQSQASLLDEHLSLAVSAVLISVYAANLIYTFVTHRSAFRLEEGEAIEQPWSMTKALTVLVLATAATAAEAELVSGTLEKTASQWGLTQFFLGVIVLALLGNAAEYVAAVYFARQNRLGLAMSVTVGSTIQIALLVAPTLVFISYLLGQPMNLVFSNPLELIAIAAVAFIVNAIAHDGEATWFEGVLLLAVYGILGIAFFLVEA